MTGLEKIEVEVDNQMQRQAVQGGMSPVGVNPSVHIGPGMEQLEYVLVLAPLEANLIVQNLQPLAGLAGQMLFLDYGHGPA